jgi:hypothetical protein
MNEEYMINWDEVPDSTTLPGGRYTFRIEEILFQEASTGKSMFSLHAKVVEPAAQAEGVFFNNFVTGTESQPKGLVTNARGTIEVKKMFKAAQVPMVGGPNAMCIAAKGAMFGADILAYIEAKGEYAGEPRNKATAYWKIGERVPGLDAKLDMTGAKAGPVGTQAGPGAVQPPGIVGGNVPPTQQAPPTVPPAPPMGAQVAPPTPPQAPPSMPPAPPAQTPGMPPAQDDPTVACPVCQAQMLKSQLAEHIVAAHK